jgi:spermidine synthase
MKNFRYNTAHGFHFHRFIPRRRALNKTATAKKTEWVNNHYGHTFLGKRLYQGETPFQRMEIFQHTTFGTMLFLDGKIQISSRDENRYHQYLVDAPLLAHPAPKSLCIVGGGDCFGLEEAIWHKSLKRILMVEIDKGVVDFCKRHYPVLRKVLKDPRIEIKYEDARKWLEEHPDMFDVLAIDLTEPHGPSQMLYTREFYQLCRRRLNPGGILSIHTDNSTLFPESFATIYKTLISVFPHILTARVDMPCFGMGWTYRMASTAPLSVARLQANTKRLAKTGRSLNQFSPTTYLVESTPEEADILKRFGRISRDAKPFDKFEKMHHKVTR